VTAAVVREPLDLDCEVKRKELSCIGRQTIDGEPSNGS
jgi:hypothetical protein